MNLRCWCAAIVLVSAATASLQAAAVEVKLDLPVRARISLQNRKSVAIAPFLVVAKEGEENATRLRSLDVQKEFERYLAKLVKRESELKLIEAGPVDFPTYDLDLLAKNQDFWAALGARLGVDLILAGSLDFDMQDRSGYRTEEYISPYDGRPYFRQVLVEETGFDYDMVIQVYDGDTGEQLYSDNFKDFKKFEGERADPLTGMFENLYSLEDRIVGVFAQREVETTRTLFTD
jgi:hypothetical protein